MIRNIFLRIALLFFITPSRLSKTAPVAQFSIVNFIIASRADRICSKPVPNCNPGTALSVKAVPGCCIALVIYNRATWRVDIGERDTDWYNQLDIRAGREIAEAKNYRIPRVLDDSRRTVKVVVKAV